MTEARLQAARALERTECSHEQYRERVVVEHRIGRLPQLGVRQSRYFGSGKTLFQVLPAATVANLTLVAGAVGDATVSFARQSLAAVGARRAISALTGRRRRRQVQTAPRHQPAA